MVDKKLRSLPQNLRDLMKRDRVTQSRLATKLGISRAAVSHYLVGRREPDIDILVRLAQYFKVTLFELTGNERLKDIETIPEKYLPPEAVEFAKKYLALDAGDWRRAAIREILMQSQKKKGSKNEGESSE